MLDDPLIQTESPSESTYLLPPSPPRAGHAVSCQSKAFDCNEFSFRCFVFFLMSFITAGNDFCYDNPSALQDRFRSNLKLSTVQFTSLYSWYSWPNVFFCFFCGVLVDRLLGVRVGGILASLVIIVGQIIFAMGAWNDSLIVMYAGRAFFGIGGESMNIIQSAYCARWFRGRGLHVVSGLTSTVAFLFATLNMTVMRRIYDVAVVYYPGPPAVGVSLLMSVVVCFVAFLGAILLAYVDTRSHLNQLASGPRTQPVQLRHLKQLHPSVWLASLINPMLVCSPFVALGLVFLTSKYDFDGDKASTINSIPYMVSAIASPIFGLILEYSGRNISWLFISALLFFTSFGVLAFTFTSPIVSLIGIGLASSIMESSIWPMVALVSPDEQMTTVYGTMEAFQNIGIVIFSTIGGPPR